MGQCACHTLILGSSSIGSGERVIPGVTSKLVWLVFLIWAEIFTDVIIIGKNHLSVHASKKEKGFSPFFITLFRHMLQLKWSLILLWVKSTSKGQLLCDLKKMQYWGYRTSVKYKVEWWMPGRGGTGRWSCSDGVVSVLQEEIPEICCQQCG